MTNLNSSFLELCNEALDLVSAQPLQSLEDNSPQARLIARLAPQTLTRLLRLYPWNCAQTWAQLQALEGQSLPSIEGRLFLLPQDCLRVISANAANWQRAHLPLEQGWTQVLIADGGAQCKIHYIRAISQASQLDPLLAQAFSLQLAAALSASLIESNTRMQSFYDRAEQALAQAKQADSSERSRITTTQSWLSVRKAG